MTILASSAARLLLQAAAAAHDTVIMRQVPPVRSWFEEVVFVASGVSTLLVLVLVTGLVVAMFAIRRSVQRAHEALDRRVAEFGERVDDFNELLGKVHHRADSIVEVGGMAMDGIAWGAKKFGDGRKRRRKAKDDKALAEEQTAAQVEANLDDRREQHHAAADEDEDDDDGHDSPYYESRDTHK